ncbi:MAG: hypothetical protein IPM13_14630 [Phycisphaerales bacterium]|nr:hypothetical protein [Phycisphaerales bacterium]
MSTKNLLGAVMTLTLLGCRLAAAAPYWIAWEGDDWPAVYTELLEQ